MSRCGIFEWFSYSSHVFFKTMVGSYHAMVIPHLNIQLLYTNKPLIFYGCRYLIDTYTLLNWVYQLLVFVESSIIGYILCPASMTYDILSARRLLLMGHEFVVHQLMGKYFLQIEEGQGVMFYPIVLEDTHFNKQC